MEIENGEIALPGIEGRTIDLEIGIEPAEGELYNRFAVRFAMGISFSVDGQARFSVRAYPLTKTVQ